jgi:glycosyltransferase involved in cell wall biosynthesis
MRTPQVLLVHNRYQQPGGEDAVVAAEATLLRREGHLAATHTADNHDADGMGRLRLAAAAVWNGASYRAIRQACQHSAASVVHFHNTFPLVSPSAYYAAHAEGAAVVQTLHNFRLICPGATLYRDGAVCADCVGAAVPLRAVQHRCYRADRQATTVAAGMLVAHRGIGTWQRAVDVYIALTEFARRQFIAGGLPAGRIVVKPNFLTDDPGAGPHDGGFALFVGRLSEEKGIDTLVRAWQQLGPSSRLKVAGSGPLTGLPAGANIEWLGWQSAAEVARLMRAASFLVMPSSCYEGFPMTLVQAFAAGLPAIVSGHGSLAEIVTDGVTGLHVPPGDADALARMATWAWRHPRELRGMGARARAEFELRYTERQHHAQILEIYRAAAAHAVPVRS